MTRTAALLFALAYLIATALALVAVVMAVGLVSQLLERVMP